MLNLKLSVKDFKLWLFGLAAGLIALHLTLTWRSGNSDLLSTTVLFWVAVSALQWKKRDTLNLESDFFSSFLGASLLTLVLLKSAHLSGNPSFLRISPFISGMGLGLLASGVKGLKQYWQELSLLGFLSVAEGWLFPFDISLLTAKFAVFVLWLLGFPASSQGVLVILPTGFVEVYQGCSGIGLMLQLLGWASILLVMVPTSSKQKIFVPVVAALLGFAVNGVRIALLAVLTALSNQEAFEYWHRGDGSLIFSAIAVLIFGVFCHLTVLTKQS
ncbi:MAG: cyanoexosortase A [Oscillatoria sp. Prado101]|jgi:cyanoexosortase A|nr:cyanoexosortase A [Oscillatoria sp. Prado101]